MITLDTPVVLPDPIAETDGHATVATASLDNLNGQLFATLVYGNNGTSFTPSPTISGRQVFVNLATGLATANGAVVGTFSSAGLATLLAATEDFVEALEGMSLVTPVPTVTVAAPAMATASVVGVPASTSIDVVPVSAGMTTLGLFSGTVGPTTPAPVATPASATPAATTPASTDSTPAATTTTGSTVTA